MITNNQKLTVYKPNELIEITGHPISTNGLLIYNFLLHQFQKNKKDKLIFNPQDVFVNLDLSDKYDDLYKYLDSLMKVNIISRDKRGKLWGGFNLLSEFKRVPEGIFIQIPDTIYNALCGDSMETDNNLYYTTIKLLEQRVYRCSHTIIFYELFKKYEKINLPIFTVKDLRLMTGTINKYPRYIDFKRYVLEKGINELNKFDKKYEYYFETSKLGKKIDKIHFIRALKTKERVVFSDKMNKIIEKTRKNRFIDNSYSQKAMENIIKIYKEEDILKALSESYKYNSEIVNFSKFLIAKIKDIKNSKKNKKILKESAVKKNKVLSELDKKISEVSKVLIKSKKIKLFEELNKITNIKDLTLFIRENKIQIDMED